MGQGREGVRNYASIRLRNVKSLLLLKIYIAISILNIILHFLTIFKKTKTLKPIPAIVPYSLL